MYIRESRVDFQGLIIDMKADVVFPFILCTKLKEIIAIIFISKIESKYVVKLGNLLTLKFYELGKNILGAWNVIKRNLES